MVKSAVRMKHNDNQQGHGADRDCEYLHLTRCAGVAGGVGHPSLLLSRAIVEMDTTCDKRQSVPNLVNEQSDADVRYRTICPI